MVNFMVEVLAGHKTLPYPNYVLAYHDNGAYRIIPKVNQAVESVADENIPGVNTTLRLAVFNQACRTYPVLDYLPAYTIGVKNKLTAAESPYAVVTNPLPTIGIEMEMPMTLIMDRYIHIMNGLGIFNSDEIYIRREARNHFSYSPYAQALFIHELFSTGIVQLDEQPNGNGLCRFRVPDNCTVSLHINFGAPVGLDEELIKYKYGAQVQSLVDLFTYAFVSPARMKSMKIISSHLVTKSKVEESKKTKRQSYHDPEPVRLELRTGDVRCGKVVPALYFSQAMAASLFSYIQCQEALSTNITIEQLAEYYRLFAEAARGISSKYFGKPSIYDDPKQRHLVAKIISEGNIVKDSLAVFHEFYPKIYRAVFNQSNPDAK